jgi:formylglycine-generating enzyme required for sulfatase activity
LWSRDYVLKFWTRFEWKTALSIGKPIIILKLDNEPLDISLHQINPRGNVKVINAKHDLDEAILSKEISEVLQVKQGAGDYYDGEYEDEVTSQKFVRLTHPALNTFEICIFQVTNLLYEEYFPIHSDLRDKYSSLDDQPVLYVHWLDANNFCKALSEKNSGYLYRLPNEIEWEFAARAGEDNFLGIPSMVELSEYAIYQSQNTSEVGSKKPNAFGIYDMLGNAAEWCSDYCLFYEYNGWINPTLPVKISDKLWGSYAVRGSWFAERDYNRLSASYPMAEPTLKSSRAVGLRLVREDIK